MDIEQKPEQEWIDGGVLEFGREVYRSKHSAKEDSCLLVDLFSDL